MNIVFYIFVIVRLLEGNMANILFFQFQSNIDVRTILHLRAVG